MSSPAMLAVLYIASGIWAALLWAYFYRQQIGRRQISVSSLFVLILLEAVAFVLADIALQRL